MFTRNNTKNHIYKKYINNELKWNFERIKGYTFASDSHIINKERNRYKSLLKINLFYCIVAIFFLLCDYKKYFEDFMNEYVFEKIIIVINNLQKRFILNRPAYS